MTDRPAHRLKRALRTRAEPQLDTPKPGSTWELFADRRLTEMEEDLKSIRTRIDALLWTIAGSIVIALLNYITGAL